MSLAHRVLLLAIIGAVAAASQSLTPTQKAELARAAKNPFDLAKFIDTHPAPGWRINVKPGTHALSIAPDYTQRDFEACKTKLLTVKTPKQAIVVIEGEWHKEFVRYTRQSDGSWQAEGTADAGVRAPQDYKIDQTSRTPFFRYTYESIHGSGIFGVDEVWVDLTRPGFGGAFYLMLEGYEDRMGTGIGRKISTTVVERNDQVRSTVHIDLTRRGLLADASANYDFAIGSLSVQFVYARTQPGGPFRCRSLDQAVSCKDLHSLTYLGEGDSPTEEYLIRFAIPGLKKIAVGSDNEAKQWLREYIAARKDTPEVRQIKALLQ